MQKGQLESSTLAFVSHSGSDQILQAEFRSGDIYQYFDVPADTFYQLIHAQSKGRYFNAHVRNCFRYIQIAPLRPAAAAVSEN